LRVVFFFFPNTVEPKYVWEFVVDHVAGML
jgi:hypothetical protein